MKAEAVVTTGVDCGTLIGQFTVPYLVGVAHSASTTQHCDKIR